MKNKYLPEELEISYTHQLTGTDSIKLINEKNLLIMENSLAKLIDTNQIKEENWIEFWNRLEKIGIWDLEENYQSCNLEADFHWKIAISYKDKSVNSYGLNLEPKIFIGNQIFSVLEELKEAIEDLIEY